LLATFEMWKQDMKSTKFAMVLGVALMSGLTFASQELATKNACMGCHGIDKKVVGPSYQDVAKKYSGQKDAETKLAASIKKGGSGTWGAVPMPAQTALSDADAATLAKWVLSQVKK
jgi:cytochrome c